MSGAIKVRVVVEMEIAKGSQLLDAVEVSESIAATLLQNIEVKEAVLRSVERIDRE